MGSCLSSNAPIASSEVYKVSEIPFKDSDNSFGNPLDSSKEKEISINKSDSSILNEIVPSVKRESTKITVSHRTSLKGTISPPKSIGIAHPANWIIPDDNWHIFVDTHGNSYYYNDKTGESQWDPPHSLVNHELPANSVSFQIIVPDTAIPGESFSYYIGESAVEIMCPIDCKPGDEITLIDPIYFEEELDCQNVNAEDSSGNNNDSTEPETTDTAIEEESNFVFSWTAFSEV
jgi:hypothetical protein